MQKIFLHGLLGNFFDKVLGVLRLGFSLKETRCKYDSQIIGAHLIGGFLLGHSVEDGNRHHTVVCTCMK